MSGGANRFFEWVAECCALLGWPKAKGEEMMPAVDPCWYGAFDDGLTPEQAVGAYTVQTARETAELLEAAR